MKEVHVQRFWHSPEVEPTLDDDGFLVDPIAHPAGAANVQVVEPAAIPRCLVLLGEPGMGKTVVLSECRTEAPTADRPRLEVDLRSVDSTDGFREAVFGNPAFQKWLNEDSTLELFLDSLDECLTEARKIAAVLAKRLPELPTNRLRLRIGCRSAEWPQLLEKCVIEMWRDAIGIRQLAPLRAEDVSIIAKAAELDGEAFLGEVRERGVGPLAARPITLKLLLATFREHHALPGSRADLYRDALVLLCQEQDLSRLASRQVSRHTPTQLLACGSRVAAALVLCNRYGISEAPQVGRAKPPIITIDDIAGSLETVKNEEFAIDRQVVRDTLATGLFEPAAGGVHTFAHRTFGEYLAASYLARDEFTVEQILDLFTTSTDDRVVPQMRDVAAWVAELRADARYALIRRDPLTAARMDIAACTDRDREKLVHSLLGKERDGTLPRFELRRDFVKLKHPELAAQLLAAEKSHGMSDLIIEIVAAVNLQEVSSRLVDTVADTSASSDLRATAAHALLRINDPSTFAGLAALLPAGIGEDPYDEIRGCLLLLLWPTYIDAETFFASVVEPNDLQFVGRYAQFLASYALRGIDAHALPIALKWVTKQIDESSDTFHSLIALILELGAAVWHANLNDENLFPQALLAQLRTHSEVLDDARANELAELLNDVDGRHRLVEKLVPHLGDRDGYLLFPDARLQLIRENDMPWLIKKGRSATTDVERRLWAEMMNRIPGADSAPINDLILSEVQTNPIVAEEFRWAIRPVDLDSPEAERARKTYRLQLRSTKTHAEPEANGLRKLQRLIGQLENADEKWWPQVFELAFNRRDWDLRSALNKVVEFTPEDQRPWLVAATERFLTASDAPTEEEVQPRSIHHWSVYGVGAMILLAERDRARFDALDGAVIQKWLPSVVAEAAFDFGFGDVSLDRVRAKLPSEDVARIIDRLIRIENDSHADGLHNSLLAAERLSSLAVSKTMVRHLDDESLHVAAFDSLLGALLKKSVADVRARCEDLVRRATVAGEAAPRALAAAKNLIVHSPDASWPLIWPFVRAVGASGQELVESQLGLDRFNEFIAKLKESEIADIVIWLYGCRSGEELGLESHIGIAICDVLNVLRKRGRVDELRRIQTAFPNRIHDQYILMAQEERQKDSWDPPTPEQLFALATDRRKRVVHDEERLVAVIIESLRRLQAQLHSDDPTAKYLWDGDRPKDEGAIRDWIRRFLNDDEALPRLITNKEVEVFDRYYTDIKVEAVGRGSRRTLDPKLAVTIEVKGCWHEKLKQAMETQLVEKYLRGSSSSLGIYLVSWFDGSGWTDEDGRKKQCHSWSRLEMEEYLSRQAKDLQQQAFSVTPFVLDCTIPKKT